MHSSKFHSAVARIDNTKANLREEKCDPNQPASIDPQFNCLTLQRFNVAKPMRAMVLDKPRQPLQLRDADKPRPANGHLLLRIATSPVCRTDLHVADPEF